MSTYNPTQEWKIDLAYFTKEWYLISNMGSHNQERIMLENLMDEDPNVTDETRFDDWYTHYHNLFTSKWKPL